MAYGITTPAAVSHVTTSLGLLLLTLVNMGESFPTTFGETLDFALQITLPIQTELPAIFGRKDYSYNQGQYYGQNHYHSQGQNYNSRQRRDLTSDKHERFSYDMNNAEGVIATRLDNIFSGLGLNGDSCQRRFLCLLSKNPEKYSPISDVIFQHLDPLHEQLLRSNVNCSSSMWHYVELYEVRKSAYSPSTNCTEESAECSTHPDDGIDWTLMNYWQTIMKFIKVEFK